MTSSFDIAFLSWVIASAEMSFSISGEEFSDQVAEKECTKSLKKILSGNARCENRTDELHEAG
jgi:hypothetical protein